MTTPTPRQAALERLVMQAVGAVHALRSYQFGNDAPDLAEESADALEKALAAVEQAAPEENGSKPGCLICGEPIICTETFCPPHAAIAPPRAYESLAVEQAAPEKDRAEGFKFERDEAMAREKQLRVDLADARAAIRETQNWLREHGRHEVRCAAGSRMPWRENDRPVCDCGLAVVLPAVVAALKEGK